MLEKQIESLILYWLNAQLNVFAFKVNTSGFYDSKRRIFRKNLSPFVIPGTADIIGSVYGRFLAIEVKTPTTLRRWLHYPTESDMRQRRFLGRVRATGGIGICVASLEDVKRQFSVLKKEVKPVGVENETECG